MMCLQWCKAQILAILVLAYIEIIYTREGYSLIRLSRQSFCNKLFDFSLTAANFALIFDAVTACSVNMLDSVSRGWNLFLHFGMYAGYEIYVALLFWYWISVTVGIPKNRWVRASAWLCNGAIVVFTALCMGKTEFFIGQVSNYSLGPSVYLCFFSVYTHCIATILLIAVRHREIPKKKRAGLYATVAFIVLILGG